MMRMFPVNLVGEEGTQKLPSIIVQMKHLTLSNEAGVNSLASFSKGEGKIAKTKKCG
jgi:hypothetical protein